jgi:hypothetical protein
MDRYDLVTASLDWEFLDRTVWNLLDIENGGFEVAANRYIEDNRFY